ncbi:helical backbone metal receptor [Streptomyces sp. NBC_00448]|uniref:helical backbone metal receptor n=1 Tax=Streptomyces sp. NBC_00448 TaxID=2903652 RepID=UPI002E207264
MTEQEPVRPAVRRVVSLVPSLTEAVAATAPGLLVGATDWCTHPADLDVVRIGGTKNPDTAAVAALAPDLVIANEEENRAPDLADLRAAGLRVLVTEVRSLPQAFAELHRVLVDGCGLRRPGWLDAAESAWRDLPPVRTDEQDGPRPDGHDNVRAPASRDVPAGVPADGPQHVRPGGPAPAAGRRLRAVVPIWRRPWMALGRDTFAGDLLARLGIDHVLAGHDERYPRFDPADLPATDLVVLPDEPYRFTADDGPESFPGLPAALVSGRHLTWYGPSLVEAPAVLGAALRGARAYPAPPAGGRRPRRTRDPGGTGPGA